MPKRRHAAALPAEASPTCASSSGGSAVARSHDKRARSESSTTWASSLRGYVLAGQCDGTPGNTPFPIHDGPSHFDEHTRSYVFRHTEFDNAAGVRGYMPQTVGVMKCHEDAQVCIADENYTLYTTAYAPKFSDACRKEALNDDADADSIAHAVLSRYRPCEPEMSLQLFGARSRQWRVTTEMGGKRSFRPPCPDDAVLPPEIRFYERSSWRSDRMTLLEFLRKTNAMGKIHQWLERRHQASGSEQSLDHYANDYRMRGEQIVACHMLSRRNDRYFGQWLVLNVPFRKISELLQPDAVALVPEEDRYMAMCLASEHPRARLFWNTDVLIDDDMKIEARTTKYREQILRELGARMFLVKQYLNGVEVKPLPPPAASAAPQPRGRTFSFPFQKKYADALADCRISWDGRPNCGQPAQVVIGDELLLAGIRCSVQAVHEYDSFEEMLDDVAVENALPDQDTVREGVAVYHSFKGYARKAEMYGVRAFELGPPVGFEEAAPVEGANKTWNPEQRRWLDYLKDDMQRTHAVDHADTEAAGDAALEDAWRENKIRVLEGPPGSGKTTVACHAVELAIEMGLKVLWTTFTAQLAGRMRERFAGLPGVVVDTCHAALGFDEDILCVMNSLAPYGLVIVDEFQQLGASHMMHIDALRQHSRRHAAFAMLGDRYQCNGFGEERVWHCQAWRLGTHMTELFRMFRCKDERFAQMLRCLRTARPTAKTTRHGGVSIEDIMRDRRAWFGNEPNVGAIKKILDKHPDTTMIAITRKGVQRLDELCLEALFGSSEPLAVVNGDIESNPRNYSPGGKMKAHRYLVAAEVPLHAGMQIYFTRNVDKTRDIANGVRATVLRLLPGRSPAVLVRTMTGKVVTITPWQDKDLGGKVYFPIKIGYATTVLKVCGAELSHVTLWLDRPFTPGAAYTAMSRVSYGRDVLLGGNMTPEHFVPTAPR